MRDLARRIAGALIAYSFAYGVLATVLLLDDDLTVQTGTVFGLGLIWLGWQTGGAISDVHAILAGRRARRRTSSPRPVSLADYIPGSTSPQQRVNRAA